MNSTGKAGDFVFLLLFAFIFIFPISADPIPDDEYYPDEDYFLSDELLSDEGLLIYEIPHFIYELRSFDELFPELSQSQKARVFSTEGLKQSFGKDGAPIMLPNPDSGIDILSSVMKKDPSHIIEVLTVVPYGQKELDILDIYNALGRIDDIKNHSVYIRDRDVHIFTETTRLESAVHRVPVSDPPPRDTLPLSETMHLRFREIYLGNLFLRGDLSHSLYGISFDITNFRDVYYFFIPIMRAERLSIVIYLEPVKDGVLIYCMSGFYLPGFIADRVNLTQDINNRVTVLLSWIIEGLRKQESLAVEDERKIFSFMQTGEGIETE